MTFRGLTWDHPRGYRALEAAAARARAEGLELVWERQPLEGFESHPIADLAARYDLVVMDHPHVGEAVAAGCFRPLDELFAAEFLEGLAAAAVGPAFRSYLWQGRAWALPLDAATQVLASRPDRLGAPAPATWDDVEDLAARVPMALSLAGPHAILSFLSICAALGEPACARDPERLVGPEVGTTALGVLRALHALAAPASLALNPIGILEAMARTDDLAFCPLVFGYVTYARAEAGRRHPLVFSDAPALAPGGRPGSTLGGTGIAVSRRCRPTPALLAHLRWLMSPQAQEGFIPAEAGQPGLRSAWMSEAVNAAWGGFYRATLRTIEAACVRPRHAGYIGFQTAASALLRGALAGRDAPGPTLAALQDLHTRSLREGPP
jgi:multiple sugar transport system substrate-binding protein